MGSKTQKHLSHSPEQTQALARQFALEEAVKIRQGLAIALMGDLGLGKSLFVRAFLNALTEISEAEILSPTFTLVEEYLSPEGQSIFHVDLYRLEKAQELEVLDPARLFAPGALSLVEWPEKAPKWEVYWDIKILFKKKSDDLREIWIEDIA